MAYSSTAKEEYTIDEIDIELNYENYENTDEEYINGITSKIMSICNKFIARHPNIDITTTSGLSELLKDIGRKYTSDINNIKELNILWDIYTIICCTCRIKPTLIRYSMMINIGNDMLSRWIAGESHGRVSSGHQQTVKKWKDECESALYDEVIKSGNIGCMFALKASYGYRDNVIITQQATEYHIPQRTRDEIAQSYGIPIGLVENTPEITPEF